MRARQTAVPSRLRLAATALAIHFLAAGCARDDGLTQLVPGLSSSPASLAFDPTPIGLSRSASVTLKNTGAAPLSALVASIEPGANASPFRIDAAPPLLDGGREAVLVVHFEPTASGETAATLVLAARGVDDVRVPLTGAGFVAPDCDDRSPCTEDAVLLDGACSHEERTGACNDENACTTDDVCSGDRCVGEALACEPPASCFLGMCDVDAGCVFVTDPEACDDGDPCTNDFCTAGGCAHDTSSDGTVCGAFVACTSIEVCVSGA